MPLIDDQLTLFGINTPSKEKKKPAWDNFYTVFMFDEIKYHKLCKAHPKADKSELKKQCYVLDETGKKKHLGDSKHIFRMRALTNIQEILSKYCTHLTGCLDYWGESCSSEVVSDYFTLYYERYDVGTYDYMGKEYPISKRSERYEVELKDTSNMPIKDRVLLHLRVLKLCKQGMEIEDACKNVLTFYRKEDIMK